MLIALADENAGREEAIEAQVDVIRVARDYLKEHPEACKFNPFRQSKGVNRTEAQREADIKKALENHDHGSVPCLLEFLGEDNWNLQKVHSLVSIADRFDAALLRDVANGDSDGHPERRGTIGITAAAEIAKLDKPALICPLCVKVFVLDCLKQILFCDL